MPVAAPDPIRGARTLLSQKVSDKQAEFYGHEGYFWKKMMGATEKVQGVNKLFFKMPIQIRPGFGLSRSSMNGYGEYPEGRLAQYKEIFGGYYSATYTVESTLEAARTVKPGSAILDINARTLAMLPLQAQEVNNILFATDGSGVLMGEGVGASSVGTGSDPVLGSNLVTMTFNAAGDMWKTNRAMAGMPVDVYAADLTTRRNTTNSCFIASVDSGTETVTLSLTSAGFGTTVVATDVIAFPGLIAETTNYPTGYSGGLTPPLQANQNVVQFSGGGDGSVYYNNATYPFSVFGITGDAFRHGYRAFCDPTSSRYTGGLLRSSVPGLTPVGYQVPAGTRIDPIQVLTLIGNMVRKFPQFSPKDRVGVCSYTQYVMYSQYVLNMSTLMRSGGPIANVDLGPSDSEYEDTFTISNIKHYKSVRQKLDEIDYLVPKNFGVAYMNDTEAFQPVSTPATDGNYMVTGASGRPLSGMYGKAFFDAFDWVCFAPGANGRLSGLAIS